MMTKVGFISLGCPKNQIDTEIMLSHLADAGYELTPEDTEADIIIVNTCGFIESAKQEAIDNILDVAWLKKNRDLRGIIVTGCLSERYREQIFEEMPEVDALVGCGSIHDIVEAVKAVDRGEKYSSFKPMDTLELGGNRIVTTPEYTAYLKIAEGCDNRCAYCAIPAIRGPFRSRPIEDIVEEAKELESAGLKELVLVAQDTTRYGIDLYGEYKLAELLHRLGEETDIPWIRLLYCYPDKITDALIAEMASNPQVVKYIDLPVQHISDPVLERMNRHGDSSLIRSVIAKLRAAMPDIIIRTTAIVGFPGETDGDFTQLCEFVKETKFDRFGAFTYSREEDTPAYDMPDQIDEQTKQDRLDRVMAIQYDIVAEKNDSMQGRTIRVLPEDYDVVSGCYFGRSAGDAPEIDGRVFFTSDKKLTAGEFVDVKIDGTIDYDLTGYRV
ncbi:MAG: 30S ribosomal protein S12 methylthiotransferase RimO [Clostridia bacterium]|nr:30S ribosomal protein S12 methylthiotransferase RimO [Clostridia bacterium]